MGSSIKSILLISCLNIFGSIPLYSQNPMVPYVGMADPHIRIFNNKAYLFATRDADSTAQNFTMPDWKIWTSQNLRTWTLENTIKPDETYMGKSNNCWAPDAVEKNGLFYFYFSNGNKNTGVMVGKSPTGPFKDALGTPLLEESLTSTKEYDPTILIDDDENETAYIAFGHHRASDPTLFFAIAKLNEDMISLTEAPKEIKIIGEGEVLAGNDKPTLHKRNGVYYLSAGTHYATAANVYGPYTRRGSSGNDNYGLNSRAHGNYFAWNNQWFHTWCHFHLGKDVARYRESYITYLHYRNNGEMVDDVGFLDVHFATGVGQYDALWEKIEAEWYMAADKVAKRENSHGGFEIQEIQNDGYLFFPNVENLSQSGSIAFNVSSENGGIIEVRGDSLEGSLLGSVKIPHTGGADLYQSVNCALTNTNGVKNLYFRFKGEGEKLFNLDWFKLNTSLATENAE